MAHVDTATAQQNGAFNNGAVGQQFTPLCQWPYVWDRVRKQCVLPDEWSWAYEPILPYGWGSRWGHDGNDLFSYGGPEMEGQGPIPQGPIPQGNALLAGLGQGCPEGSGTTAVYTGPQVPGTNCRCSPGRVWEPSLERCVSPESVAQQAGMTWQETQSYAQQSGTVYAQQPLSASARNYIESRGHTIDCRIDPNWFVGPQGGEPAMTCSIDGGPYIHAAYAINLNPGVALTSEAQQRVVEEVSRETGIPPGSISSSETASAEVIKRMAEAEEQLRQETQAVFQTATSAGSPASGGATVTLPAPPPGAAQTPDGGYQLPDGSYVPPGTYAGGEGGLGDIPTWVWVAGAVGAYMVFSGGKGK